MLHNYSVFTNDASSGNAQWMLKSVTRRFFIIENTI